MTIQQVMEVKPLEWIDMVVEWIAFTHGSGDNEQENLNNVRKKDCRNNHLRGMRLVAASRAYPEPDRRTGATPKVAQFAPAAYEKHQLLISDIPNQRTFKRKYLEHRHFDRPRKYVRLHTGH